MGVLTPPGGDDPTCLASKPKERQFQVSFIYIFIYILHLLIFLLYIL